MVKKFLDEQIFEAPFENEIKKPPVRKWPVSQKEQVIRDRKAIQEKLAAEEAKIKSEQDLQERELTNMAAEDHPALSAEEIAELAQKKTEEEEAAKNTVHKVESAEMSDEEDDELDDDPEDSDRPDEDY